jgi:Prealbumin-like fold domain
VTEVRQRLKRRRRSISLWVTLALMAAGLVFGISGALAVTAPGNFEIDTNANLVDDSGAGGADDWLTPGAITADARPPLVSPLGTHGTCNQTGGAGFLFCDPVKSDPTTFPGGAKEPDPPGWLPIQSSQVTPKTDITNVYALGRIDTSFNPAHPVIINGMERLPKAGDVHLDFELNKQLNQAGTLPDRQVGDILIAYDMGGNRNNNLGSLQIRVFIAKANTGCSPTPCAGYDYDNPNVNVSGSSFPLTGSGVTASMNTSSVAAGPWKSYDDGYNLVNTIDSFGFAEAAIDLADATGSSGVCVNFINVKSRASESVTSQLKDTTGIQPFPFCGGLKVKKYIDVDESGTRNAGDIETGTDVSGWSFTVKRDSDSSTICTGTTDNTGSLVCSTGKLTELTPGSYTATESPVKSGFVNTDPSGSSPFSKSTNVTIGADSTIYFGNTCLIDKTFQVTGVPSGVGGLFVFYTKNGGAEQRLDLAQVGQTSTWSATVTDGFRSADSITWGYGINKGQANEQTQSVGTESFSGAGWPTCSKTNSVQFATSTVTVRKYKDVNGDGVRQPDGADGQPGGGDDEGPLAGFEFQLKSGNTVIGSSQKTNANGVATFSTVTPGSYTIHEVGPPTGWLQTQPAAGADANVTVTLGSDPADVIFGDTPLSKLDLSFTALANILNADGTSSGTAATHATISCKDGGNNVVGSQSGQNYTANNLKINQSVITCTVTITDP